MTTATASAATHLPTPEELPAADVVIYDGHCRFCRGQVERIARFDGRGRLAFMSLHDDDVYRRFPGLTHDELMQEMVVVDRQGGRHKGAASIRYLSRRLPAMWVIAPLLHIPLTMPIWRWLYRQVAQRRYLIAGKLEECDDGACKVHYR